MNIAEVRGALAIDGIHLNQEGNQWHTLTLAKALIGSCIIYPKRKWSGECESRTVYVCVDGFNLFMTEE